MEATFKYIPDKNVTLEDSTLVTKVKPGGTTHVGSIFYTIE